MLYRAWKWLLHEPPILLGHGHDFSMQEIPPMPEPPHDFDMQGTPPSPELPHDFGFCMAPPLSQEPKHDFGMLALSLLPEPKQDIVVPTTSTSSEHECDLSMQEAPSPSPEPPKSDLGIQVTPFPLLVQKNKSNFRIQVLSSPEPQVDLGTQAPLSPKSQVFGTRSHSIMEAQFIQKKKMLSQLHLRCRTPKT